MSTKNLSGHEAPTDTDANQDAAASRLHCPNCGGDLKIIAAILEQPVIEKILTHLGLDPQPPPRAPAREPARHQAA